MATNRPSDFVTCPRCDTALQYAGTKNFHEGTRLWDFLGGLFELFKHREAFDVYVCPRCGRIEFFVDGIGEELRGEPAPEQNVLLQPPVEPAPEAARSWKCPACGSRVPGPFAVCWKCQTRRGADQPGSPPNGG
ncbi:MAG: hypothetical protein AB1716_02465 [Planctomycetota bacterium]